MLTVYASIGNSDDKLSQLDWSTYVTSFIEVIRRHASMVHGVWFSAPDSRWQNACVCFEVAPERVGAAREELGRLRILYDQDSIAWAPARTEFI